MSKYIVMGFAECPYYRKAVQVATQLAASRPEVTFEARVFPRNVYHQEREKALTMLGLDVNAHTTCPLVYEENNKTFLKGCDDFTSYVKKTYKL